MYSLNINAKPFYPNGHVQKQEKLKVYYNNLDKKWWEQNKNMFIDSLADSKWLLRSIAKNQL